MKKKFFIYLFCFLISFVLYGYNLKSGWHVIDDHAIISLLGNDKKIKISEFPEKYCQSGVCNYGHVNRFIPAYFSLRLIESYVWGQHVSLWYLFRIILLSIFLFYTIISLNLLFPLFLSVSVTVLVLGQQYWQDIFGRLGSAEAYIAPLLAIYGYYYATSLFKELTRKGLIIMTITTAISIWCKENFIFLSLFNLILFIKIIQQNKEKLAATFMIFITFVVTALTVLNIYLYGKEIGQDVYGHSLGIFDKLKVLVGSVDVASKDLFLKPIILIVVIMLLHPYCHPQKIKKHVFTLFKKFSIIVFFPFVYIFQLVFYNLDIPAFARYNFPIVIVKQLFILFSIYFFILFLNKLNNCLFPKKALTIVLSLGVILNISYMPFTRFIKASKINAQNTRIFTDEIDNIAASSYKSIVINVTTGNDFEPYYSIARFIKYYSPGKKVYLQTHLNTGLEKTNFVRQLENQLDSVSQVGFYDGGQEVITPISQKTTDQCLEIVVGRYQSLAECQKTYQITHFW